MNKLSKKLDSSGSRIYIAALLVFAAVTYLFFGETYLAVGEAAAAVALFVVSAVSDRRRQRELQNYIESVTYESEEAKNSAVTYFPLPMATFLLDSGRLVWGNQAFFTACGFDKPKVDVYMADLVPGFQSRWLLEGKKRCPDLMEIGGRRYQVNGSQLRGQGESGSGRAMGITYWLDVTDYDDIKREYAASRPVILLLLLDNYDELIKNATERAKADIRNAFEDKLAQWVDGKRGFWRRYDRDRYIFVCERRYFDRLKSEGFSLLDEVHTIVNTSGIHATVSIGAGIDGASLEENFSFAALSIEMALSRGGDQVVIRDRMNFEFIGGRESEVETRTKVKSRVVANALGSFIKDASTTYVMGHRYADMDALGAAVGVCCIARSYGKRVRIVMSDQSNACGAMIAELRKIKEYEDIFITPKEAMLQANARSLLVVVDTNRPEQVEDEALLQTIRRLVVIDHHRRAATYIENAALTFYEPYASSACELMTELLQELVEQDKILRVEAEAMLAGIVTDTKNFTMRTGERTFDAAAYLRRAGADPVAVKKLLQNDYESTVVKYAILERAERYRGNICIAAMDRTVDRVTAAQAADELLNISGIEASVVLYPTKADEVYVSARSIGSLNVQMLLEQLGGGGNMNAAGAQLHGATVEEAVERLKAAIDAYLS